MNVLFNNNQIFIQNSMLLNDYYLINFGINKIQGNDYAPKYIPYYENEKPYFKVDFHKNKTYITFYSGDNDDKWTGTPIELMNETINDIEYTNVSEWLFNYSKYILEFGYKYNSDEFEIISDVNVISTEYSHYQIYPNGTIQLAGIIKSNRFSKQSDYSVILTLNIVPLPNSVMVPRIGDTRIGYFYQNIDYNLKNPKFVNPTIIIHKRNVFKKPWIYIIDRHIDKKYWRYCKIAVMHWNVYFKMVGIDNPLIVYSPDDSEYPLNYNIFDTQYNYIVPHNGLGLNGDYSGYSQVFVDFRSGEILFGNIYINFNRIESSWFRFFNLYQTKKYSDIEMENISKNGICWIIGHEIGHQLGLRHNFISSEIDHIYGSIMDYIEFQDNFENYGMIDINLIRSYDLYAILYGYVFLKTEKYKVKPPSLEQIADLAIPFKTDDMKMIGIVPNIIRSELNPEPLENIEYLINKYSNYRHNLINKLKNGQINHYQYANGFIFIFINMYKKIIDLTCKYIGGRYFDFNHFKVVENHNHLRALTLLLHIKNKLKYTEFEYDNLIYDFSDDISDIKPTIQVKIHKELYYGHNITNLFTIYQDISNYYLTKLTKSSTIIRLNSGKYQKSFDLLYQFSFCTKVENEFFDIKSYNGIFSEIGLMMIFPNNWENYLDQSDIFDQYLQFTWIDKLSLILKNNGHYFLQMAVNRIFKTITKYAKKLEQYYQSINNNLLTIHWNLIIDKIKNNQISKCE